MKPIIAMLIFISFYSLSGEECKGRLEGFKVCYEVLEKVRSSHGKDTDLSDFEMGLYKETKGDYSQAHLYYLKSTTNERYSSFLLGLNYLEGLGTEKNNREALKWFVKSSEQEFDKAMYNAASIIISNRMSSKYNLSYHYLIEAKKKGNNNVYYLLGKSYLEGLGVESSISKSLDMFSRGALNNDPNCIAQLAYYYLNGKYLDKDEAKGWELMYRAQSMGSQAAKTFIESRRN